MLYDPNANHVHLAAELDELRHAFAQRERDPDAHVVLILHDPGALDPKDRAAVRETADAWRKAGSIVLVPPIELVEHREQPIPHVVIAGEPFGSGDLNLTLSWLPFDRGLPQRHGVAATC